MESEEVTAIEVSTTETKPYYYLDEITPRQLLSKYGEGSHIPGSGSAAALSALLATELIKTVCIITNQKDKPEYKKVHKAFKHIVDEINTVHQPRLYDLFREDIETFDLVSKLRIKRMNETSSVRKAQDKRKINEALIAATEIPLEISRICLNLMPFAFRIFDEGYKTVRGDSGVAISNLLSAISGALFIAFLNIRDGVGEGGGAWIGAKRAEAENMSKEYARYHKEAFKRISQLYAEKNPEQGEL